MTSFSNWGPTAYARNWWSECNRSFSAPFFYHTYLNSANASIYVGDIFHVLNTMLWLKFLSYKNFHEIRIRRISQRKIKIKNKNKKISIWWRGGCGCCCCKIAFTRLHDYNTDWLRLRVREQMKNTTGFQRVQELNGGMPVDASSTKPGQKFNIQLGKCIYHWMGMHSPKGIYTRQCTHNGHIQLNDWSVYGAHCTWKEKKEILHTHTHIYKFYLSVSPAGQHRQWKRGRRSSCVCVGYLTLQKRNDSNQRLQSSRLLHYRLYTTTTNVPALLCLVTRTHAQTHGRTPSETGKCQKVHTHGKQFHTCTLSARVCVCELTQGEFSHKYDANVHEWKMYVHCALFDFCVRADAQV